MSDPRSVVSDPGSGTGGSGDAAQVGRKPPSDPDYYLSLAKDYAKESVKNANASLGQMLTLSTALLGGLIAFWKSVPLTDNLKFYILVVFLLNIVICVIANRPMHDAFLLSQPADSENFVKNIIKRKKRRIFISQLSLIVSIMFIVFGVVISTTGLWEYTCGAGGIVSQWCPALQSFVVEPAK